MDREQNLRDLYNDRLPLFNRACNNVTEALSIFLSETKIPYLTITSRVKEFESFYEKIDRKNYADAFNENEDFCGARIVLYHLNDIKKVIEIISSEFYVQENEDKGTKLDINEFGYRSHHFIVKFREEWLTTPNYRGLNDIKIEIQVRTILMHAWAEIEHKLGYKNKEQVPSDLKRKLFMISAKLEEADGQFQELKSNIEDYKKEIISDSSKKGKFTAKEFNLNSFQALLDFYFLTLEKDLVSTTKLFLLIQERQIPLPKVVEAAEKIQPYISLVNQYIHGKDSSTLTSQSNVMSYAIEALFMTDEEAKAVSSESRLRITRDLRRLMS
jgi:putative GTP pyrophosphokinase